MKKYFIVADVHGFYDKMQEALDKASFDILNPEHIFVSLGDVLDRGNQPRQVLQFINSIQDDKKILIRGNHEDLMLDMIKRKYPYGVDFHNGTAQTVFDFFDIPIENTYKCNHEELIKRFNGSDEWNNYISKCVDFAEVGDYIFVHGWIPCKYKNFWDGEPYDVEYNENWREGSWKNARWYNGMRLWDLGIKVPQKTICCGHWHTSWGHSILHHDGEEWLNDVETGWIDEKTGRIEPHCNFDPFEDDGIIAMDACTAYSGQVNCKVLEVE